MIFLDLFSALLVNNSFKTSIVKILAKLFKNEIKRVFPEACSCDFFFVRTVIIVLISADEAHPRLISQAAGRIKEKNPDTITVLAQDPGSKAEEYQSSGIDLFIHPEVNAREVLSDIIERIGIIE